VPEALRTEELEDILEQLRAMLRAVDSSLLDEWQSLRELPEGVVAVPTTAAAGRVERPLAADPRALGVRVRGELHRLLQALARKQWEEALAAIRPNADDVWTAERLAAELAPYFAEHARIDVTPRARRPSQTVIEPAAEAGTFTARQRILDPEEDEDWMIDAFVDARGAVGDGPLIELRGVRR
ncbi:MAG: DUF3516 domain-containing protein, partial [Polyangia bacterium]